MGTVIKGLRAVEGIPAATINKIIVGEYPELRKRILNLFSHKRHDLLGVKRFPYMYRQHTVMPSGNEYFINVLLQSRKDVKDWAIYHNQYLRVNENCGYAFWKILPPPSQGSGTAAERHYNILIKYTSHFFSRVRERLHLEGAGQEEVLAKFLGKSTDVRMVKLMDDGEIAYYGVVDSGLVIYREAEGHLVAKTFVAKDDLSPRKQKIYDEYVSETTIFNEVYTA